MFWGLILKANKRYTQVLEKPFHLSLAALDHSSADDEPVQVMYSHEENSYLLCTLQKGEQLQCPLDLNFATGDKVCFMTKGSGIVHLTGFLIPEEDFGDFDSDEDEEEEDEELEVPDLREKLNKKEQKANKKEVANKKKKPVEESDDEDSDDDSDDDEIQDENEVSITKSDDDEDDDEDEEDDEDESDDDDDEDEEEEEEIAPPKAKQAKIDQQESKKDKKQQNGVSNGQEKKKDKKGKESKEAQKQPQQKDQKDTKPGQMQKLQGGLMFQDLKVGNGAEAKPGKKIQVYYEGRLKSNNKVFDSTKSGPGFKMSLGRGEVIKGWDLGLVGMKVGGKRRLICPPQMGYGARGNPPVIPANSTLVFDVELKNVL